MVAITLDKPDLWAFIKALELAAGDRPESLTLFDTSGKEIRLASVKGNGGRVEVEFKR